MMFSMDYAMKQEQYKDLLREAERERLVGQVTANHEKPAMWQNISDLLSRESVRNKVHDSGRVQDAKGAA